jgi:hypothetical protein
LVNHPNAVITRYILTLLISQFDGYANGGLMDIPAVYNLMFACLILNSSFLIPVRRLVVQPFAAW